LQDGRNHSADRTSAPGPWRSGELNLLLLCSRWPQRETDREQIREQSAGRLDWQSFVLLVRHHRLVPLVAFNLGASITQTSSPELECVIHELRQLTSENMLQALRSLAELRRVSMEFVAHNIRVRVLKGLPLAQSVFGDLSLRAAGDIDLLIDESALVEADRVLRGLGYQGLFQVNRFTPRQLNFYRSHWKDIAYRNPATGFEVDLHWRCFRNSKMPGRELCAARGQQTASFGGFAVETLPRMEALLYLCVHGTLDGWIYFKSLVDVAAQVREMTEMELDLLARLATNYAILPELTAALILVQRYLAIDHWSQSLLSESDATVAHILRYAGRSLVQSGFLADRDAIPIATTIAFELGLRRDFRYRFELLLRVLFRARMWETIPLPDFLFGIYPLLSPVEWVVYRVRQWKAKPAQELR
jgi:hypothetical protein